MERNPNDGFGTTGAGQNVTSGSGMGGSLGSSGSYGAGAGSDFESMESLPPTGGTDPSASDPNLAASGALGGTAGAAGYSGSTGGTGSDQSRVQKGKEMAQQRLGQVKEKATELQATLADRLEQGAQKLRERNQSGTLAGAGAAGGTQSLAGTNDKVTEMGDQLARGLDGTAQWLRDGDRKGDIENQIKTNPGRTLLIAAGLGYLLGKAFRK